MSRLDLFNIEKPKKVGRNIRVASQIREKISESLMRADLPQVVKGEVVNMPAPITITSVDLSPDLKNAKVYVMPLGGDHVNESIEYLEKQAGNIKHYLAKNLTLRFVPSLSFKIDTSFDYSSKIDNLLKNRNTPSDT